MIVLKVVMVMVMVIAMTTNKDYWKLRIQHHIRKRMGKWAVVYKVVMNDGDGDHDRHDDDGITIK